MPQLSLLAAYHYWVFLHCPPPFSAFMDVVNNISPSSSTSDLTVNEDGPVTTGSLRVAESSDSNITTSPTTSPSVTFSSEVSMVSETPTTGDHQPGRPEIQSTSMEEEGHSSIWTFVPPIPITKRKGKRKNAIQVISSEAYDELAKKPHQCISCKAYKHFSNYVKIAEYTDGQQCLKLKSCDKCRIKGNAHYKKRKRIRGKIIEPFLNAPVVFLVYILISNR